MPMFWSMIVLFFLVEQFLYRLLMWLMFLRRRRQAAQAVAQGLPRLRLGVTRPVPLDLAEV
jgi:hypothetical protein